MALAFPTATIIGETYTENNHTWKWTGTAWNRIERATSHLEDSPPTAIAGQTWWNTSNGKFYYYDTASNWVECRGPLMV